MQKKVRFPFVFASLLLAIGVSPALAGMYKWVDEQGITHYSQTPPPSGNAQQIKPPPTPADSEAAVKRLEAQRQEAQKRHEAGQQDARESQKSAESQAIREESCRLARQNLNTLEAHSRVAVRDADGNMKRLSEEERQTQLSEAKKQVDEYCNK